MVNGRIPTVSRVASVRLLGSALPSVANAPITAMVTTSAPSRVVPMTAGQPAATIVACRNRLP